MTVLAIKHVPYEGMGLLEGVLEEAGLRYQYLEAWREPFPPVELTMFSGLVVMGGPMGVYEAGAYPFLSKEIVLLKEALEQRIPTLGICLGSQLLAQAAGGRVYRGPIKEIGWFPIQARPEAKEDPLLQYLASGTRVLHWHGDTFDLPQGAVSLASSERYREQAFRIEGFAWGLQFHLEVTEGMVREWIAIHEQDSKLAPSDWNPCELLTQSPCFLPEVETPARKVFGAFASLVKAFAAR